MGRTWEWCDEGGRQRKQQLRGESKRRDRLEGYHLELGAVVAAKNACCGRPAFAPIEIGRLMMWAGRGPDAMCLWRNLRSLGLLGYSRGLWEGNEEGISAKGMIGDKRRWKRSCIMICRDLEHVGGCRLVCGCIAIKR